MFIKIFQNVSKEREFLCAGLLHRIHCIYFGLYRVDVFLGDFRIVVVDDIVVAIERHEVLWRNVVLVTHAESRCPSRDTLKLVLEHIATAVALDDEQYLPPAHLIEILVAVASYLAYDRFERFVGVSAFFDLPDVFALSLVSRSMVGGTNIHSCCICATAFTISITSSRDAL